MNINNQTFFDNLERVFKSISSHVENEIRSIFSQLLPKDLKCVKKTCKTFKEGHLYYIIKFAVEIFEKNLSSSISQIFYCDFLNLMKFIAVYVGCKESEINNPTINNLFDDNTRENIYSEFRTIAQEIENLNQNFSIDPDFPNIFSAVYHYFKHKNDPCKRTPESQMSVQDYYALISLLLNDFESRHEYLDFVNESNMLRFIYEKYLEKFQRRIRLVLYKRETRITISSCYIVDTRFPGDQDGDTYIRLDK